MERAWRQRYINRTILHTDIHDGSVLCKAQDSQGLPAATPAAEIHIWSMSSVQLACPIPCDHSAARSRGRGIDEGVRVALQVKM
jgi:hypothetical protein